MSPNASFSAPPTNPNPTINSGRHVPAPVAAVPRKRGDGDTQPTHPPAATGPHPVLPSTSARGEGDSKENEALKLQPVMQLRRGRGSSAASSSELLRTRSSSAPHPARQPLAVPARTGHGSAAHCATTRFIFNCPFFFQEMKLLLCSAQHTAQPISTQMGVTGFYSSSLHSRKNSNPA